MILNYSAAGADCRNNRLCCSPFALFDRLMYEVTHYIDSLSRAPFLFLSQNGSRLAGHPGMSTRKAYTKRDAATQLLRQKCKDPCTSTRSARIRQKASTRNIRRPVQDDRIEKFSRTDVRLVGVGASGWRFRQNHEKFEAKGSALGQNRLLFWR